jgi:hypothetical protein
MNCEKIRHIGGHLATMAKGHGLTIMIGSAEQMKALEKDFRGMCVFITDGEESLERQMKTPFSIKQSFGPLEINITKNRFGGSK